MGMNPIAPTLLAQGADGGKSLVYQTAAAIKRGMSLISEYALSLSTNKLSKATKTRVHANCLCLLT